ncbi:MAG: aldehyde dehydrogenase family protein, partial [Calditrichia bacterium]|nr:aldehyde dehydrogenase family protein [Calditrichia bacterium]
MKYAEVKNYVSGKFTENNNTTLDVINPSDGIKISTVPLSNKEDLNKAVEAATAAYPSWSKMTIKERVQIFYKYKTLLEQNLEELATIVHEENGKTMGESIAEVAKSVELTEFACSMPQLIQGEILEVSPGVECRVERKPLGVIASIAPFNFPHMVPHWTLPNAIALGNCMILKPSEIVPISAIRIAEML